MADHKKKKKPKGGKKYLKSTHVAFVLDKSGSMKIRRGETISAFNGQIDTVRTNARKGGKTRVSMVQFGGHYPHEVEVVHDGLTPGKVPKLTRDTYVPSSMTPMRDGIGRAINMLEPSDDGGEQTAFLVIVFSDGLENASQEWSHEALSARIKSLEATDRWTFVYIGTDHDVAAVSSSMSFRSGNAFNFMGDDGVASVVMAAGTAQYFAGREVGVTSTSTYVGNNANVVPSDHEVVKSGFMLEDEAEGDLATSGKI